MTELFLDKVSPDELQKLNQVFPSRYPFLLQSTARAGDLGRHDILFAFPGESLVLENVGELKSAELTSNSQFLGTLDSWWQRERIESITSTLPFRGGWFLYLGYELAAEIEPRLTMTDDPLLPAAFAVRCPVSLCYDHHTLQCVLSGENDCDEYVEQLLVDLSDARIAVQPGDESSSSLVIVDDPPEQFTAAVEHAKKYIEAGDIYQANLSRQWTVSGVDHLSSDRIYTSLCAENPGPFAGIARWQGTAIISSSPERLLCIRDGEISTRPIAGTRPRGNDEESDGSLSDELFAHPKERAEHVMLIDLGRNDLGRVCEPGSVQVDEMMVLESYAHVHHIVSNVRGRLKPDVTPGGAIAAVFPGGTITGCPKVRCMEIISDLEVAPRGAYTGSFGYLNLDGSMDLNILIRTIVKTGNELTFRAGAGIVADSDPRAELNEARAKAEGMLRAVEHA